MMLVLTRSYAAKEWDDERNIRGIIFAFLPLLLLGNVLAHRWYALRLLESDPKYKPEIVVRPATPEWHIDF
ncbi:hypothetical protein J056_002630 [Wallemia ichthyophaga EXF-994]|uniref:Uncharacterized protein n=1 Tax=Wallemia ichthyophaga (strain EXF-994 / CBS 113033) TaxID=1299270 RepID=R9A9R3_WALI9|nr:uncharacterized protein J056_002630 [Wallemia ichthyophaga EXF-994]EOQ98968.1 hypothetical protein J056_002630 [Wallemia ichthyophaga EXF-994]